MKYALLLTLTLAVPASVAAQVPANIEAELLKIGQVVDPSCTAKLYRPLMPASDFNTYWPPDAAAPASMSPLYPGVTIIRDQSFGANAKDVLDIFVGEKGGNSRPVVIYVPGGGGKQGRAAGARIERLLRQHRPMGDEERHGRRHRAAASRIRQLGRRRP